MNGTGNNRAGRPPRGLLRHPQVKARRLQRKTGCRQYLTPLLEDRQLLRLPRNPIRGHPPIPKMFPSSRANQTSRSADKSHRKKTPVRSGKIEGGVKSLTAQSPEYVPVLPKRRAFDRQRNGPRPVHARRQLEQFRSESRRQRVNFGARIMPFDFPQGGNEMDGVTQETKIDDDDLTRAAGEFKKTGPTHGKITGPDRLRIGEYFRRGDSGSN